MAGQCRFITRLYNGDTFMGLVDILPQKEHELLPFRVGEELRVSSLSPASERCFPLVVLHTIASNGVLFKMEPAEQQLPSDLKGLEELHSSCLKESKTAIILLEEGTELHLVAMNYTKEHWPCFWGFSTPLGLYNSCLTMLNLRCLALVFDLDETLIVANTMRSFEDRIEVLERRICGEVDSQRLTGMTAELKRYQEDKMLLKQFIDHDHVWDTNTDKLCTPVKENVPPHIDGAASLHRPIIRMQERNMIFTRINPNVRDTSVLVRIRPAWEELRSYLTAKGRKRFEVYICTMSEKDYALEMWRLLDPEAQLIGANALLQRVVCVKSGSKKSLVNVFSHGRCHPNMAMVIDDRLKVWDDGDQSHVHVVPAFAPYYAPQAEMNCTLPILCVARNVAGNVRSGFFKDFDEGLSKKLSEIVFDTDVSTLPQPPDVSNYLVSEEGIAPPIAMANGMKDFPDGMTGAEVEMRLKPQAANSVVLAANPLETGDTKLDSRPSLQQQLTMLNSTTLQANQLSGEVQLNEKQDFTRFQKDLPIMRLLREAPPGHIFEPSIQNSPAREEGEVPESELDPDTRRRLLILQHGQDTENPRNMLENTVGPSFPLKVPLQVSIPSVAPAGGWLGAEEERSPHQLLGPSLGIILEPESPSFGKQRFHSPFFPPGYDSGRDTNRHMLEECAGEERLRSDPVDLNHSYSDDDYSLNVMTANVEEAQLQPQRPNASSNPVAVLQEIAEKCNTRVEFKSLVITTKELQFSVEVVFGGDKVGGGIGRTNKEAQHRAAEDALRFMASQYISQPSNPGFRFGIEHLSRPYMNHGENELGQHWNSRDPRFAAGLGAVPLEEGMPVFSMPGQANFLDFRLNEELKRSCNAIAVLKDWGTIEGVNVVIKESPTGAVQGREVHAQVEVAGRVMGKGSGPNWEAAKQQAAEEAVWNLKIVPQPRAKRSNSPRSPSYQPSKRPRAGELNRGMQRPLTSPRRLSPRR